MPPSHKKAASPFYTVWLQQISRFTFGRIHGIFYLERATAHKVDASGYG